MELRIVLIIDGYSCRASQELLQHLLMSRKFPFEIPVLVADMSDPDIIPATAIEELTLKFRLHPRLARMMMGEIDFFPRLENMAPDERKIRASEMKALSRRYQSIDTSRAAATKHIQNRRRYVLPQRCGCRGS